MKIARSRLSIVLFAWPAEPAVEASLITNTAVSAIWARFGARSCNTSPTILGPYWGP